MMRPYFSDGGIAIYHGDCREVLPVFSEVDVTITDPPYSEHVHTKSRAGCRPLTGSVNGRSLTAAPNLSRQKHFGFEALTGAMRLEVATEIARLTKRWALAFSDVESCHLWRATFESVAMEYVRTGLWIKIGCTPQFTGDRPAVGAESITIVHPKGRKRWNGGGSRAVWAMPIALNRDGNSKRNHPTEKPLRLMTRLVRLFSEPDELILDPFMGSGTTLLAASLLGRRAVGIELDERHCESAAKRLTKHDSQVEEWARSMEGTT